MLFSVPNLITYGRIILIPAIIVLMAMVGDHKSYDTNFWLCFWAMILFSIAGISDLVDGYYARRYKAVSNMGKFIDPMADKLIHMTALVMLIPLGRIPAWIVVVLLFREIFISGVRAVAAAEGVIIDAAQWGKYKTAWLNVGLGAMILYYPLFQGKVYEANTYAVGVICVAVGLVFSIASGMQYTARFFKLVNKSK
jgi:CDP-diacylglycerol---glycerol-3-phosphate 3-phosphatidyltransferase